MPKSKIRKKATRKQKRIARAYTKQSLITILGLTEGCLDMTVGVITADQKTNEQLNLIREWVLNAWETVPSYHRKKGAKKDPTIKQATDHIEKISRLVGNCVPNPHNRGLEVLVIMWLMVGNLVDEATKNIVPNEPWYIWDGLNSVVHTWIEKLLLDIEEKYGEDTKESTIERAGNLEIPTRDIIFERPPGYFGKLYKK